MKYGKNPREEFEARVTQGNLGFTSDQGNLGLLRKLGVFNAFSFCRKIFLRANIV